MYIYILLSKTMIGELYGVGFFLPRSTGGHSFHLDSEWHSRDSAAMRVSYLNGGDCVSDSIRSSGPITFAGTSYNGYPVENVALKGK